MSSERIILVLPIELKNGNAGRTKHFGQSHAMRKLYAKIIPIAKEPISWPAMVTVVRVLGAKQRFWDASSGFRGNFKELEDTLIANGWFTDDSVAYIPEVRFVQYEKRKEKGPCTILIITPYKSAFQESVIACCDEIDLDTSAAAPRRKKKRKRITYVGTTPLCRPVGRPPRR